MLLIPLGNERSWVLHVSVKCCRKQGKAHQTEGEALSLQHPPVTALNIVTVLTIMPSGKETFTGPLFQYHKTVQGRLDLEFREDELVTVPVQPFGYSTSI